MSDRHGESRREFLKKAGTAAWAAPLILTATAGRAAAQVGSCSPAGMGCGTWSPQLNACIPNAFAAPCCNDCVRGAAGQEQFCFCT